MTATPAAPDDPGEAGAAPALPGNDASPGARTAPPERPGAQEVDVLYLAGQRPAGEANGC